MYQSGNTLLLSLKSDKKLYVKSILKYTAGEGVLKLDRTTSSEMYTSGGKLTSLVIVDFNFQTCSIVGFH